MSDEWLTQPLSQLTGIGDKLAIRFAKLGILTLQDALFLLPTKYQDRSRLYPLASLKPGQEALIQGCIQQSAISFQGRRRALVCVISDQTTQIGLRLFHFNKQQQAQLKVGQSLRCYGSVRSTRNAAYGLEMIHPDYQLIDPTQPPVLQAHLTPVYPQTDGISQGRLRAVLTQVLTRLQHQGVQDLVPQLAAKYQLLSLTQALQQLHHPTPEISWQQLQQAQHPAQQRLIYEELLSYQLGLQRQHIQQQQQTSYVIPPEPKLLDTFLASLPYVPTQAQSRVCAEIAQDLQWQQPMLRLLQGDVGSGKTLVAAISALPVMAAGYQVALMAPTELLAEQHYQTFLQWLQPLGIEIAWLGGKQGAAIRRETLQRIATAEVQLVIGTHALFQAQVNFANLAYVIIDEQHRFGVHQRLELQRKGQAQQRQPHQLIMTATPIPRTLAMSLYSGLETSVIDELPPGRQPITTVVIADSRREQVIERIRRHCASGQQVYWVCTLIDSSEPVNAQAATEVAASLMEQLPELQVAVVHGRLTSAEKEQVMGQFHQGQCQLLVATTVIEVGVNVPNASLMVIDNPERLGLAQLHQLRGRVGRGQLQSYCVLLYQAPLSRQAKARLSVLRDSQDGFFIAEEDLRLRGPGEVLGTRQAGLAQLRIADLGRDAEWLQRAHDDALWLWQHAPQQAEQLLQRWLRGAEQYRQV